MKIAILNDYLYHYATGHADAAGGAERVQWLLARALAAAGYRVRVALARFLPEGEQVTIEGVEFVGLAPRSKSLLPGGVLRCWQRFLAAEKVDWLYWMCADHRLGPVFEMAHLSGARTAFSLAHDADVNPRVALSARRSLWPLYAWGLARADRIFVQHDGQFSGLPEKLRKKATFLPSIVNLPPEMIPHAGRDPCVAWIAMLRKPKRPDLLVEVARRSPGVRFRVVGGTTVHRTPEGYGESVIAALRGLPNVEFLGRVPFDEVARLSSRAGLLLSTADEEGFPSTFLEAWAAGTPVVSLTVDPNRVIERYEAGRVTAGVENAIPVISELIASPGERDRLGANARRYVVEHHTVEAVVPILTGWLDRA